MAPSDSAGSGSTPPGLVVLFFYRRISALGPVFRSGDLSSFPLLGGEDLCFVVEFNDIAEVTTEFVFYDRMTCLFDFKRQVGRP